MKDPFKIFYVFGASLLLPVSIPRVWLTVQLQRNMFCGLQSLNCSVFFSWHHCIKVGSFLSLLFSSPY